MNEIPEGYEQLHSVFMAALDQAAIGKGKERHANGLPFHDQRMQRISTLLNSPDGMAYQTIKKMTEGMEFTCPERREAELLGAIVYLAGIVIWYRNRQTAHGSPAIDPVVAANVDLLNAWDKGEERMNNIGPNGNDGLHYDAESKGTAKN